MQDVAQQMLRNVPLAVDLDETLISTDSLHESCLGCLKLRPRDWQAFSQALRRGKAAFKREIASRLDFEAGLLPYNHALLEYLRCEKQAGRRLGLFTASDQIVADKVADHLGLFNVACGSDGVTNLDGARKAEAIRTLLGERFAYAGNAAVDKPIFECAEAVVLVGDIPFLKQLLPTDKTIEATFPTAPSTLRTWVKQLRIHHWIKNILVFAAPLFAFKIGSPDVLLQTVALFLAMGCLASATYVINDLFDLPADREHRTKRFRPLAAGVIAVRKASLAAAAMLAATIVLASFLSWSSVAVLGAYFVMTMAYSFALKRQPIVDVIVLAGLFTLRVLAGSVLLPQPASPWLLTFSMLFFTCLAILKRYIELNQLVAARGNDVQARGYTVKDIPLLLASGIASGFASIVIFTLYMTQEQYPRQIYGHPQLLWMLMPLILVWILRIWHLAVHGRMNDDPLLFAFSDRFSLALGACGALVLVGAWS
jgi:4-hydroxybenzoate polyprenyltransferase